MKNANIEIQTSENSNKKLEEKWRTLLLFLNENKTAVKKKYCLKEGKKFERVWCKCQDYWLKNKSLVAQASVIKNNWESTFLIESFEIRLMDYGMRFYTLEINAWLTYCHNRWWTISKEKKRKQLYQFSFWQTDVGDSILKPTIRLPPSY